MSIGIFFCIFVGLLFIGTPIGVTFAAMTLVPMLFPGIYPYTAEAAVRSMASGLDSFPMMAIPLFILAGVIMAKGKISEKIFNVFAYFIGNRTAGLPCAVVVTCLFYGAISGSGPATTAAVGAMAIPFLINVGYDPVFSTALVAVSGGLGIIIPPSIPFIVYSTSANVSISQIFIAGILPGLLIGGCLMAYAYIYCRKHGEDKEKLRANYEKIHEGGLLHLLKDGVWSLLAPVIILGSIYGGIASPTEAAAISIYYALFVSIFVYKTLKVSDLLEVLREGVRTYAAILFVIASAVAFSRAITVLNVAGVVSELVLGTLSSKVVILLVFNLVLLVAGMVMDTCPAILIFTPVMLPIAMQVGINPVHFGIIMTVNLAIGFVTPPMGVNLFVASNLTGIPVMRIAGKVYPFIAAFLISLLLITFIPQISLLLI